MILTPIESRRLPEVLAQFERGLADDPRALGVFRRIADTRRFGTDLHAGRPKAVELARTFGIPTLDDDPANAFSWDGRVIRTRSETSVVFHEIAHWQVAPAKRRALYDFGLGAGPETGRVDEANAAACVENAVKEEEENLASLLGILWETAHDEPAVLAFAEQNWLELPERPHTPRHFARCLVELDRRGLVPITLRHSRESGNPG
jgi:hypothetical protein